MLNDSSSPCLVDSKYHQHVIRITTRVQLQKIVSSGMSLHGTRKFV